VVLAVSVQARFVELAGELELRVILGSEFCLGTQGEGEESPAKASRRARAQKGATEERSNKKAEVIAMMKRAKGATLAEIAKATGWQNHTVRGFASI
jgi:hypothetical protein